MSGLYFLSNEDFIVRHSGDGLVLCTRIPAYSFVLFYSHLCDISRRVEPIFRQLTLHVSGIHFATINVSNNKDVVVKSAQTIFPIKYVPLMLAFVDGRPFSCYRGDYTIQSMQLFLQSMDAKYRSMTAPKVSALPQSATAISSSSRYTMTPSPPNSFSKSHKSDARLKANTTGVPVYGDNEEVKYLEFKEAYPINI